MGNAPPPLGLARLSSRAFDSSSEPTRWKARSVPGSNRNDGDDDDDGDDDGDDGAGSTASLSAARLQWRVTTRIRWPSASARAAPLRIDA